MNVTVTKSENYTLVSVEGRVDSTNAGEFEKSMLDVVAEGGNKIILDCSELNYISSTGLRIFLIVQKKMMANNGHFCLCGLQAGIKEIFDISGFSSIFKMFPDKESAI